MDISNTFANIGEGVLKARERAGIEEVIGEDGMPYCKKCGEPLTLELTIHGSMVEFLGEKRRVPRNCACMREQFALEYLAQERQKRAEEIRQKRLNWLTSEKYRRANFTKDDGRAPAIRKTCERYVEIYKDMIAKNMGMGFLGGNGGGKTFWASCIANALIEAGATVYMSTLTKIIQEMNADYGENRDMIMRKIKNVDFLILDDYGAEKPLIITANLTEEILKNPPSINYARSYSRIIEMCPALIKVEGERRTEIAADKRKALAYLMRG